MLKKLQALDSSNAQKVLDRIRTWEGEDAAARYAAAAKTPVRRKSRRKPASAGTKWPDLLARRKPALRSFRAGSKKAQMFDREVRRDRRLARRKIFFPENLFRPAPAEQEAAEVKEVTALCGASGDVATNDTGLPFLKDAMARRVEAWCKHGSWAMCQSCGSMQPRPLQPVDLRRLAPPTISEKACTACRHGEYVPQPDDIPQQLRHLKLRVLRALRPLDIDTGTFQRAQYGYSSMVTFAWASQPVEDKIAALRKRKDRASARAALEYLLGSDTSSYKSFYDRHHAYLQRHGSEMPEKQRKLPLLFLEEEGLEGALWPHLYWRRDLCETVARASHESRQELEEPWTRTPAGSRTPRTTRLAILALAAGSDGSSVASCARFFRPLSDTGQSTTSCTLFMISASGQPLAPRRMWPVSSTFQSDLCSAAAPGRLNTGEFAIWRCLTCSASAATQRCFAPEHPTSEPSLTMHGCYTSSAPSARPGCSCRGRRPCTRRTCYWSWTASSAERVA